VRYRVRRVAGARPRWAPALDAGRAAGRRPTIQPGREVGPPAVPPVFGAHDGAPPSSGPMRARGSIRRRPRTGSQRRRLSVTRSHAAVGHVASGTPPGSSPAGVQDRESRGGRRSLQDAPGGVGPCRPGRACQSPDAPRSDRADPGVPVSHQTRRVRTVPTRACLSVTRRDVMTCDWESQHTIHPEMCTFRVGSDATDVRPVGDPRRSVPIPTVDDALADPRPSRQRVRLRSRDWQSPQRAQPGVDARRRA